MGRNADPEEIAGSAPTLGAPPTSAAVCHHLVRFYGQA